MNGTRRRATLLFFAGVFLQVGVAGATEIASSLAPLVRVASHIVAPAFAIAPIAHHVRATGQRPGDHRAARSDQNGEERIGLTLNGSEQAAAPARLRRRRSIHDAMVTAVAAPHTQSPRRQRDETRQILRL